MPLTSPTFRATPEDGSGTLFVVGTPIGNPDDITLRAIRILNQVDFIAAEDTRKTRRLLAYHKIKAKLISFHEHNEASRSEHIVDKLQNGATVALVSDAGTPSVSDPGYRLVQAAVETNIKLVPVPGTSAVIAALSVSGLPTDHFVFVGFLPKKSAKRKEKIQALAPEDGTIVFYESPKRILQLISDIIDIMGNRRGVLSREMTKPFEEFIRGRMSDIFTHIAGRHAIKGECTLLVSGQRAHEGVPLERVEEEIEKKIKASRMAPSALAKEIAREYELPRKTVYDKILLIKGQTKGVE